MPISTVWYDPEHRILDQRFVGDWRWEEVEGASTEAHGLAHSVPYDIVLICDMSQTKSLPKGNVLSPAKSSMGQIPENIVQIIFVIQSRLIEVFATLLFEMIPRWKHRAQIVKTREAAEKLARAAAAKLNQETRTE